MYLPLTYGESPALCIRIDASSNFGEEDKQVYCELHVGFVDETGKMCSGDKRGAVLHTQSSAQLRDLEFSLPRDMRPWNGWRVQLKVWTCKFLPFGFTRHHGSFIGKSKPISMPFRRQETNLWLDKRRGGTKTDFSVTWSAQRQYFVPGDILSAAEMLSRDIVKASITWDDKKMDEYFSLLADGWDGCEEKCLELILHAYKPTSILYEAVRRKKRDATQKLVALGAPLHQLHIEECKSPYTLARELDYLDVLLHGAPDVVGDYSYKQLVLNNFWDVILLRLKTEKAAAWVSRAAFEFAWNKRWPKVALEVVSSAQDKAFVYSSGVAQCLEEGNAWIEVANALLRKGALDANAIKSVFGLRKSEAMIEIAIDGMRKLDKFPKVLLFQRCTECVICFEPTYANIPSYFVDSNRARTCAHYLCHGCAVLVASNGECPICRVPFRNVVPVPNIKEEPEAWFKTVDSLNNGFLTKLEVLLALEACLPVDKQRLADAMTELWDDWTGKQDVITADDFFKPKGLFEFVLLHEDQMIRDLDKGCFGEECQLPAISSPAKWFDLWCDGVFLTEFDMLRGLLKTLKVSSLERPKMYEIQKTLKEALETFATGDDFRVDKETFIKPGGVGELLQEIFFPGEQPVLSREISKRSRVLGAPSPMNSRSLSTAVGFSPTCAEEDKEVMYTTWEIDMGPWKAVSDYLQNLLEASIKRRSSSIQFHLDGDDYEVTFITDLEGMQTNLTTGRSCSLRRQIIR